MPLIALSNTDDWELSNTQQDIRGSEVLGPDGTPVGTVRDMILDTEAERVTMIVLDNGTEIPASEIEIRDGVVTHGAASADGPDPTVAVFDQGGHVTRRERVDPSSPTPGEAR